MPCSPVYAGSLYPCDLTDAEWALLAPLLPAPARRGRPRAWPLRLLINALFYVLRTGCAWRYLPREYPPWQTAYTTWRQWRLLPGVQGDDFAAPAVNAVPVIVGIHHPVLDAYDIA